MPIAQVSLKRLEEYLLESEVSDEDVESQAPPAGMGVVVERGTFSWFSEGAAQGLSGIHLAIPRGRLVCVVGPTGSGKSSLLHALLGEMQPLGGAVAVHGRVAYAAQQAWIFKGSLRDNVLFGDAFESRRYHGTIDACQLRRDLDQLAAGDEQEIGEGGVNLSGGQKQRLSVARAVYADADTYLFDDSLSALDAHVGKALFEQCFVARLRGRTRVLVCNQLHFLPQADWVVVMDKGRVAEQGTYADLVAAGKGFAAMVRNVVVTDPDAEAAAASSSTPAQVGAPALLRCLRCGRAACGVARRCVCQGGALVQGTAEWPVDTVPGEGGV